MIRRRLIGDEQGAAMVETALILPVFFAVLMGVFFMGWAAHCGGEVRQAAERAGRAYAMDRTTSEEAFRRSFAQQLRFVPADAVSLDVSQRTMPSGAELVDIGWSYGHALQIPMLENRVLQFGGQISIPRPPA